MTSFMNCPKDQFPSWLPEIPKSQAQKLFLSIIADWQRKKPLWVAIMLQLLIKPVTSLNPMLDIYLPKLAKKWQKDVLGIETLMESCDVLNKLQDNSLVRFGILT